MALRKKNKINFFTLIEVILTLGLLSLLFSTLFFWYVRFHSQGDKANEMKWPLVEERYADQRLKKILSKTKLLLESSNVFCFFTTQDKALVFTFDRGPHLNPSLSHIVLGKIYHDAQAQTLNCTYWPQPKKGENVKRHPSETLILLDEVINVAFEFYFPPKNEDLIVRSEEISPFQPKEKWQPQWEEKFKKLPLIIKIVARRKGNAYFKEHDVIFLHELPHLESGILWR